jgi:hypothetical protein
MWGMGGGGGLGMTGAAGWMPASWTRAAGLIVTCAGARAGNKIRPAMIKMRDTKGAYRKGACLLNVLGMKGRKKFFFEKKNQKTFLLLGSGGRRNIPCKGYKKSFAELFLQISDRLLSHRWVTRRAMRRT